MKTRCYNVKQKCWKHYGGRGIFVCDRWLASFKAFIEDMGHSPTGSSIDRINNDGPYSPENCRWATYSEQAFNRRPVSPITFRGKTKSQKQWAKDRGLSPYVIHNRLRAGWSINRILTTPTRPKRRALPLPDSPCQ